AQLEQAGELERALEAARRGIVLDPLREETHCDVMRLYAALGQPAAARHQYQELERLLQQELEAEPDEATCALLREIERGAARHSTARHPILRPGPPSLVTPDAGPLASSASNGPTRAVQRVDHLTRYNRLVTLLAVGSGGPGEMGNQARRTDSMPPSH